MKAQSHLNSIGAYAACYCAATTCNCNCVCGCQCLPGANFVSSMMGLPLGQSNSTTTSNNAAIRDSNYTRG